MYQPPYHLSCTNPSTTPYTNDVQYHIEDRRNPIFKHNNAAQTCSVASFYSCVTTFLPKTHAGSTYIFTTDSWRYTQARRHLKPIRTQPFTNTNLNDMHNFSSCFADKTVKNVKVNQSHYRPGVAQRVPGS